MWEGSSEELLPYKVLDTRKEVCPDCKKNDYLISLEEEEIEMI
jgi:transposase